MLFGGNFNVSKPVRAFDLTKVRKPASEYVDEFTLAYKPIIRNVIEDVDLVQHKGKQVIFDVEAFPNFFIVGFKIVNPHFDDYFSWECSDITNERPEKLAWILSNFTVIGFNSNSYDMPLCIAAANGFDCKALFKMSVDIIQSELSPYNTYKRYKLTKPEGIDHIDLFEVAPLDGSLKLYAGRLNTKRMQDLPYPYDKILTTEEKHNVIEYNGNDLDNTELLLKEVQGDLELRISLGKEYGVDLRSKSDAQIAEQILKHEYYKLTNKKAETPHYPVGTVFNFMMPKYAQYQTPQLQHMMEVVRKAPLVVTETGSIALPPEIAALEIKIGDGEYRMGIGGLHSSEKSRCYVANDEYSIVDRDVASFYPAIILNSKLFPKHMGPEFLTIYQSIVDRRLAAKKAKNKVIDGGLKIAINGTFGKLANMYSAIYQPNLCIQICLTGQLALLMLIEAMEISGIKVISANTDGLTMWLHKSQEDLYGRIIKWWESVTGYTTEEARYSAIYSRDVNNYIAIKPDGKDKSKGAYSEFGSARNSPLSRNPQMMVCNDAVKAFLATGKPVEETIRAETRVTRFVTVRSVTGGARKSGQYLGKTVRWYQSNVMRGCIEYVSSGNKVPETDGAMPLMELPEKLPIDLDYDWYIEKANDILEDLGIPLARKLKVNI